MVKVSLQIVKKDGNDKKSTDKIAYVNPTATNEQLLQFSQMLIALTNDSHVSTTKVTEEDL